MERCFFSDISYSNNNFRCHNYKTTNQYILLDEPVRSVVHWKKKKKKSFCAQALSLVPTCRFVNFLDSLQIFVKVLGSLVIGTQPISMPWFGALLLHPSLATLLRISISTGQPFYFCLSLAFGYLFISWCCNYSCFWNLF